MASSRAPIINNRMISSNSLVKAYYLHIFPGGSSMHRNCIGFLKSLNSCCMVSNLITISYPITVNDFNKATGLNLANRHRMVRQKPLTLLLLLKGSWESRSIIMVLSKNKLPSLIRNLMATTLGYMQVK